jgi:hypothetical protein
LKGCTCSSVKICKGLRKTTQNSYIYGEHGRLSFKGIIYFNIKFWLKRKKYVRTVYPYVKDPVCFVTDIVTV